TDGEYSHCVPRNAAHDRGPRQVELLLNGDAPQGKDDRRGETLEDDPPIAGKERESHACAPTDLLTRNDPVQRSSECEENEVQRPDAQDASQVESTHIDFATLLLLAQQQLGNEIRAKGEEDINAKRSHRTDSADHSRDRFRD